MWRGGTPPWSGVHEEEGGGHWLEIWSPERTRLLADGTLGAVDLGPAPDPGADHPVGRPHTHVLQLGAGASVRRTDPHRRATVPRARRGVRGLGACAGAADVARGSRPVAGGPRRWAASAGAGSPGRPWPRCPASPTGRSGITAEQLHERLPVDGASLELDQLASPSTRPSPASRAPSSSSSASPRTSRTSCARRSPRFAPSARSACVAATTRRATARSSAACSRRWTASRGSPTSCSRWPARTRARRQRDEGHHGTGKRRGLAHGGRA